MTYEEEQRKIHEDFNRMLGREQQVETLYQRYRSFMPSKIQAMKQALKDINEI